MARKNDLSYISNSVPKSVYKEFSRLNLLISNYAFDANVIWCRVAFNKSETWNTARHRHSFYELHLCLSGSATFEDKANRPLTIQPKEFIFFPPKHSHRLRQVSEDFSKLVFGFTLELKQSDEYNFLKKAFENIPIKVWSASQTLIQAPARIINDIEHHNQGFKLMVSEILSTVIIEIARIISSSHRVNSKYENIDTRLDALILYMQDNLSRHLTVEDFAALSNMSSRQLNRIMLEKYNMSVADYFKKERIEAAKSLLVETSLSMNQIAQKVGFSDEYSLHKIFTRMEGLTPSNYRATFFSK